MGRLSQQMQEVLRVSLADTGQRKGLASRLEEMLPRWREPGEERVGFSVIRWVLEHPEIDQIDRAFGLAARDYRDLFMSVGHAEPSAHLLWAAEVLKRCPKVVLEERRAKLVSLGPEGWVRCPSCHFRFKITDNNAWDGKHHKRCGERLSFASDP